MKFNPPLFHPNSELPGSCHGSNTRRADSPRFFTVYASGDVCISILHAPGDDPNAYESSSERWSPVQSVEKILLSVISMLAGESRKVSQNPPALTFLASRRTQHRVGSQY